MTAAVRLQLLEYGQIKVEPRASEARPSKTHAIKRGMMQELLTDQIRLK
jgi:hypothetical protein